MEEPNKMEGKRNSDGTFAEGHPGGPGRPKGKTLKEYAREYFYLKTDAEKREYIEKLEEKKPGFAWEMGEGKAKQDTEITGTLTISDILDTLDGSKTREQDVETQQPLQDTQ